MSTVTLASLVLRRTKAQLMALALEIAEAVGLPVTSWKTGDPTKANFSYLTGALDGLEEDAALFAASAWKDYAEDEWLTLKAEQDFGVERVGATYATTTWDMTNSSGAQYVLDAGDLIVKNTTSGKTYTSTSGGTLAPLGTLSIDIVADEAGSDSNAAVGEIDDLVTTLLGVTGTNPAAAVGLDEETDDSLRDGMDDKLAALSPNGPRDVYDYVARNSELTGIETVTRSRTIHDHDYGEVTTYIADADGPVTGGDLTAVQDAFVEWAAPLTVTPTAANVTAVPVAVTYELWLYEGVNKTEDEVKEAVDAALVALFAARPIGGDIKSPATTGKLYVALIRGTIRNVFADDTIDVSVTSPAGDTALAISEVATFSGTATGTISFEENV